MPRINRSISLQFIVRSLAHAPDNESYGEKIAREAGITSSSVYRALESLIERGFARRTRQEPGAHGTPRRYVQLTIAGLDLARKWNVLSLEAAAAQRLRAIAESLGHEPGSDLHRAADQLVDSSWAVPPFDSAAVVAAVLGPAGPDQ
ncbi:hypothetical protein CFP71_13405 [Amycolatopsis thailandensis]|uniref:Transcription regulator TrmB N-terminal domain-containing protein n=1 Tax=Amycolatopsis thailandensis TaxID=589330 RepID=A0A229SC42_9PSEU|nr:helix-turn-helix domain-containing protein [Amycolatopsis thailandensis]OXM56420.1 hypothetical protein CFP71_13405 [Amycolatopsis thailandensis]